MIDTARSRIRILLLNLAVGVILIGAASSQAQSRPLLEYLGQELTDFDVCFYRYDVDNPYVGLESSSYECRPVVVETRTEIAPAAFFFRRGELITPHHGAFFPHQYQAGTPPRVAAIAWKGSTGARIDLSRHPLSENEHWGLIIQESPRNRPSIVPIVNPDSELVPADTPVTVVRVRDGRPVAFGDTMRLRKGSTRKIESVAATGVVVRFRIGAGMAEREQFRRSLERLTLPSIYLIDKAGRKHSPAWRPIHPGNMNGMLFFFPHVPEGEAQLRCEGGGWETTSLNIEVSEGMTVIEEPIVIGPASH